MNGSVHPSVCMSVTPFSQFPLRRIIMKYSGVIIHAKSDIHAKGQVYRPRPQRSKSNLTVSGP